MTSTQLSIVGLLLLMFAAPVPFAKAEDQRPNFLVILCDDLGYGDLGCFGHPQIKTPHLDRLAKQGVRLTDAYSAAPVCSAARAGILTGRTPTRVGVYDWIPHNHPMHVPASEVTIAGLLKEAGYDTCHSGKWHCNGKFNSPDQPQPGDHGFNHWFSTQNNAAPTHENPVNFVRNGKEVGPLEGYSCQIVADEASRWLKSGRDQEKPFFAWVCFHEPHEPVASPPDLVSQYASSKKRGEAEYYANVANMDRAVGSLMKTLDDLNLTDNTLVYFTSDNGPETLDRYNGAWRSHGSPGPLRGMKLHIYEGGIRVPSIARLPGKIQPGTESAEPFSGVDLLPTLCAMAGVTLPEDLVLDGANATSALLGKKVERDSPLFWHYYRALGTAKVAIRDGDWKLVAHWDGPVISPGASLKAGDYELIKNAKLSHYELYNLKADIAEENEVAAENLEVTAQMAAKIQEKYAEVIAEAPEWKVPAK